VEVYRIARSSTEIVSHNSTRIVVLHAFKSLAFEFADLLLCVLVIATTISKPNEIIIIKLSDIIPLRRSTETLLAKGASQQDGPVLWWLEDLRG
jgi:hypothetical protein